MHQLFSFIQSNWQAAEWNQGLASGWRTVGEHPADLQDYLPGSHGAATDLRDHRGQDWCRQRGEAASPRLLYQYFVQNLLNISFLNFWEPGQGKYTCLYFFHICILMNPGCLDCNCQLLVSPFWMSLHSDWHFCLTLMCSFFPEFEITYISWIQGYRPSAQRASILFFVLNDMGRIDPMYQFSLDAYIELFIMSIEKSQRSSKLEERIQNLNEYHTYAVYR